MSIPRICATCGDLIGEESSENILARLLAGGVGQANASIDLPCPGRGKHPPPLKYRKKRFFGLIERVIIDYPETGDMSVYDQYIGPPSKLLTWFAITFGTQGSESIFLDGRWVK